MATKISGGQSVAPSMRTGNTVTMRVGRPIGVTSKHAASKPRMRHPGQPRAVVAWTVVCSHHRGEPDPACKACRGVAQQQRGRAAAPPPHARVHRALVRPTPPLSAAERAARYYGGIPAPSLTSAQRRRIMHKLHHDNARRRTGLKPTDTQRVLVKTPRGTSQPRSRQLSRGFRKMLGKLRPADRQRAMAAKR